MSTTQRVRCAIYTRKSSEEGLEQDFNSLDAQREACGAYILSQASEGWTALPDIYDDGGISGGTLARPALQRLLGDIAEGRIDIVVVYKVDRLTRSLLDFSKLVEAFDKAGTSFVSVTQSFNTTTSMGRLTLNMLLSFAQFEREVTAERIRDKIAASKARGMWMGGTPPLGYKPDGRSLAIVEDHAEVVRTIYARYLAIGNVRLLAQELASERIMVPIRTRANGKAMGGGPFLRGQLYTLLKCRTYIGEIAHGTKVYPGLHPAIIERDLWDRVQAMLESNVQGQRSGTRVPGSSLLAGKLVDGDGAALIATHASKQDIAGGKTRYRYYVSRGLQDASTSHGLRIPAREIEAAVIARLAATLDDPIVLLGLLGAPIDASLPRVAEALAALAGKVRGRDLETIQALIHQVSVLDVRIEIACDAAAIAAEIGIDRDPAAPRLVTFVSEVRLTRSGHVMRLIDGGGAAPAAPRDDTLIRLIARGHRLWHAMRTERLTIAELAQREGCGDRYLPRVLKLAFLSPRMVEAILAGGQRAGVDGMALTATGAIVADWDVQAERWLAGTRRTNAL